MSDRLSLSQVAALMTFAAAMAGGQLLFKTPALRGAGDGPLAERIAGFLLNGYFFVALILYAALTVLWVWILSFTPLSRAYPFLALAFALTPALGCLVFAEPLSMRLMIGIVLILGGLFFIAG
jgi:drug/metabolite transporter (DMT)-like permease